MGWSLWTHAATYTRRIDVTVLTHMQPLAQAPRSGCSSLGPVYLAPTAKTSLAAARPVRLLPAGGMHPQDWRPVVPLMSRRVSGFWLLKIEACIMEREPSSRYQGTCTCMHGARRDAGHISKLHACVGAWPRSWLGALVGTCTVHDRRWRGCQTRTRDCCSDAVIQKENCGET